MTSFAIGQTLTSAAMNALDQRITAAANAAAAALAAAAAAAQGTSTFTTPVSTTDTTASTSTTTGSLKVSGGAGIAGALFVGGSVAIGSGDGSASPGSAVVRAPNGNTGTNTGGGGLYLAAGQSTGTGSAPVFIQTTPPGSSGSGVNSPRTAFTITAGANIIAGANDNTGAPSNVQILAPRVASGNTDVAGANMTLTAGLSSGAGAGGSLLFQTAAAGTSGTAQNGASTRLTIDSTGTATFAKRVVCTPAPVTDAATIATDGSLANTFTVTLGGNRTLANPTNLVAGTDYKWVIKQDGTGSRTLAYGTAFKWPNGSAPVLSTAANAVDILTAYTDGTNVYANLTKAFS